MYILFLSLILYHKWYPLFFFFYFSTLKVLAKYFDVSIDYLLDYTPKKAMPETEKEMLRIFRSLTAEQQYICIEQCKIFIRVNYEEKKERRKLS